MARPKGFAEQDALQAAMETFWQKGYHHTSIQDLVQAMGINRASLYDTFTDKHTLYLAALQHYHHLNAADMAEAMAEADTARAKIQAIFNRVVQDTLNDRDRKGCFMTNATLEMLPHYADVEVVIRANAEHLELILRALVQEGINSGEFGRTLPPNEVVPFLLSQLTGLRVLAKNTPHAPTLNAIVGTSMRFL